MTERIKIVGVDPGRKGAAAFITGGGGFRRTMEIYDLPFDDDGVLDYDAMHAIMRKEAPDFAYVENVWPRNIRAPKAKGKGMGFISSNKFMKSVGAVEGIIAGYVVKENRHKVTPQAWMRDFGLIRKENKSESRAVFAQLYPQLAKAVLRVGDDGRAEAGLIGIYGAIRQGLVRMERG